METYEYNGEKYYFKKGKWLKSDYTVAPISVVTELNKLLMEYKLATSVYFEIPLM